MKPVIQQNLGVMLIIMAIITGFGLFISGGKVFDVGNAVQSNAQRIDALDTKLATIENLHNEVKKSHAEMETAKAALTDCLTQNDELRQGRAKDCPSIKHAK